MGGFDKSEMMDLAGKAMVIVIIVLTLGVAFVLLIHLYAKWFRWRVEPPPLPIRHNHSAQRRRPRRLHHHRFVFTPDSQDPLPRPLDLKVLSLLPVVIFQAKDFEDEGLDCTVCLNEVVVGEKIRLLPECNHGFHVDCIDIWFQSNSTCPLCRCPVDSPIERPQQENNGSGADVLVIQSPEEVSVSGYSPESQSFSSNVLVQGDHNHTQLSSGYGVSKCCFKEEISTESQAASSSSSSSSSSITTDLTTSANVRQYDSLVIDVPNQIGSESADESKAPTPTQLRSLKWILGRDKKASRSPTTTETCLDLE